MEFNMSRQNTCMNLIGKTIRADWDLINKML